MAKGDDAVARKRNKARRKKNQKKEGSSSSSVSARVASLIAAKKRRQAGVRRKCQGMCFNLPTLEDPFNDRHGKKDSKKKGTEKAKQTRCREESGMGTENEVDKEIQMGGTTGNSNCPSKFLNLCLSAIEKSMRDQGVYGNGEDRPLFVDAWGVEFLKCYLSGKDVLETSGSSCTTEQIAWIVSIAADSISRKEKEGLSLSSPFLLFLVPSQEKAAKVRMVCKHLKALGIHTVSLHPGASLDHQILGLKSCEPEFLVSTPERLVELVSLQAIDVSGVSFLVVDGLESFNDSGFDTLKSIRQSICGNPFTVVFNDFLSNNCASALQNLLSGSVCRLSLNHSIASQGAYILQTVDVCSSEQEKLSKGIQALHHACDSRLPSQPQKVLYVVGKDSKPHNLVKILKANGFSVSSGPNGVVLNVLNSPNSDSKLRPEISMINIDHTSTADLGSYEIIVLPNFVPSMDDYVKILTRMSRHSVIGILHSFLTKEHASLAGPLIQILEQCGQVVPEALRNLHHTASILDS